METKETERNDATLLVKIADKLLEAQSEIDQLVLHFALGKAEARDVFKETKKEFSDRVSEFKGTNLDVQGPAASQKLRAVLEELEVQLNLGKADSKDMFEAQRKKIEGVIRKIRLEVRQFKNEVLDKGYLDYEIEKFKLKLEVLLLRFELKKFEVRDSVKDEMQTTSQKIERTVSKLKEGFGPETNLSAIRKEARGIYKHLRKAIESI
jgi:hypothetical protein